MSSSELIHRILPDRIDNSYVGRRSALWLFGVIVVTKLLQGLSVLYGGSSIIEGADGIPLDQFTERGARTVETMFAFSGYSRVILSLLCLLTLVRYRSAIPFMFMLLAIEYLGKEIILQVYPLVRDGNPIGPMANLVLFVLTMTGLLLFFWPKRGTTSRTD